MKNHRIHAWTICLTLCAALLWAPSCAFNPVTGQRELMLLSEPDEIRLGDKTDGDIVKSYGMYDDAALGAYVENLGQRMAKVSHRPHLSFQFKVLDSAVVNAFAVPGGYVYLTRGILSYLNSEAALAGVIGHEIGHVAARHSAQQYSKTQIAQLGLGLGTALSEDFRRYSHLAHFGVGMLFLRFSRDNERQADDLGVEYASKAGFDASHMGNFFHTLQRLHPSSDRTGLPSWFSTHPDPPDRIRAVQEKARDWALRLGTGKLQVNRDAYFRAIDGLVFGEDPRQGYVDDNVFYHPELAFQFPVPSGWKVNNTPAQVQIVTTKQDAVILFSLASGPSSKEVAREFIAQAKAQVLTWDAISVNTLPATRLVSHVATQKGPIRVMSHFIQKDTHICVFHGFTPQPLFQKYTSFFQETMGGFKTLSEPKRINVKPDRLRIRVTKRTTTLKDALRSVGVPDEELEDIALLNGGKLQDTIPAKTLLKTVEKGR
ncbi:MAG: M48 family metalloprotease [Thermodesulfobacteriota bacterium]|nr:M48 family metalloprotease [Thermodesulfobacteriota bacterium]